MKWKYSDYVLAGFAAVGASVIAYGFGYLAYWAVWAR